MSNEALDRLAKQEEAIFNQTFLSPTLRGMPICIRIAGIVMHLRPVGPNANHNGWGVFQPTSFKTARFVREATLTERREYISLFPQLFLIPCRREDETWYGIPANQADTRFRIEGLVPIRLAEEIELFQVVQVAFDGRNCWFDKVYSLQQPTQPRYLREELQKLTEPADIDCPGLRPEQRDAYLLAYGPRLAADIESKRDKNEDRLRAAIERAGGSYQSYIERGNTYTVEYRVGNETHRSVVNKETLSVESAGICLSGGDTLFDLQSLVHVVRQGQDRRRIVRVGLNYSGVTEEYDDDYE